MVRKVPIADLPLMGFGAFERNRLQAASPELDRCHLMQHLVGRETNRSSSGVLAA